MRNLLLCRVCLDGLSDLVEEILSLIKKKALVKKKHKVEIRELKDKFNVSIETTKSVVDFLVEFGFVRLDESKRYIMLSTPYKRFLEGRNR